LEDAGAENSTVRIRFETDERGGPSISPSTQKKSSIESEWVEDEVNKAYTEERSRKGSSFSQSVSTTP
jgi:hypothetical protein